MHRLLLSGILWFGLSALGVLHGQEFSMYDFNPIEAQPGFESAAKFSNWKKNGAGTWSRTTGTTNSGSAKGQLSGDLRNGATLINDLFYVRVPQEGINYITVIAWVRRNGSNPLAINIHAATNPEALPIAGGLGTALNPGTGNYSRIQFTFLAQNGALYFPVIYAASTASSATLFVDDVFIYTSTRPAIDETAPPNPFGFSVDVVGDAVELNFTNAPDDQLDLVKTIVLRYDNVVNQNNTAPAVFRPNSIVSTQAEAGANLFGTGRVVYAGPSTTKIIDNATANAVTYVVYSVDKAHNYSIANTGQTMPRILVLKNGASGQSITNNFTTAAFWIGPGSTYTIAGAATMNMSDNGAPGGSKVFGTMWQNTGNINQRANPSSTILYKSGSRHINNRNTVQFPDGNYMPFATWEEGSVAVVTGNKPQGLGNTGQLFHNFIWETSHLGVNFQFGRGFGVKGDFIIRNTYDTAARIYRTLLMPDTVMLIGGNFIIENTATAKVFFPGPANDSLTFGAGNTIKFIGTGNQAFTNNNLTYELFSLDISKPSGSFRLQQDLRLRGNLRVDAGHFDNGDYKLVLKGTRADAALPQIISGEVPISFKEVEVNNTNNAPSIATQQVFRNGQLSNIDYHIADSNYVVVHNDFTVREKLHMVSGKLIAGSKTLTINQAINYAETPAPAGIGGKNNFLGGRPQGNLLLTGNEPQKLLWGIGDNQLDTLRLKYNHADNQIRATLNGLESIFVKNLLLEEGITGHGSKLVQAMDVENAYLWITDSLGISPNSVLNNVSAEGEVTNLSRGTEDASASDAPRNGFGFGIGGNMRVDGTWT
ncbi:MAG: hypothetical protein MUF24_13525, partial [Chitinophagaceae bacterium]|nr:hypothetical protein [Chitinophagaceae bacterium]